jgi:3-oxoacid CoA-transferase subunit B
MARRAARENPAGSIVNLGIGLPTQVADYSAEGHAWLHSENGCSAWAVPVRGDEDPNLINAGKQTVTVLPGGSTFDSASSFAMIRGGHVDLAILGAMQVSAGGDLANWAVPGGKVMGIGGAMDLASGCRPRDRDDAAHDEEARIQARPEVRLPADRRTRSSRS